MEELQDKFCEHFVSRVKIDTIKQRYPAYKEFMQQLIKCMSYLVSTKLSSQKVIAKLFDYQKEILQARLCIKI